MKKFRFSARFLVMLVFALAFASLANAQATRTWVSGVGDDANPCSRTAPCKTFAGAISKTAPGGEIDCLDPGGFGAVTITKALTIDCDSGPGGVLVSGTNGIVIAANASTDVVTLRSINIVGLGTGLTGVQINSAKAVHLVDLNIKDFTTAGVGTNVSAQLLLTLKDVTISECASNVLTLATGGGIVVAADLDHVQTYGGTNGINAQNGTRMQVHNSTFFASAAGVNQSNLSGTGSIVFVTGSTFSLNTTALQSIGGANIGSSGNVFGANGTQFNANGGSISSGSDNIPFQNGSPGLANGPAITKN